MKQLIETYSSITVHACTFLSEISEKSSNVLSNQQCNAKVVMYLVALRYVIVGNEINFISQRKLILGHLMEVLDNQFEVMRPR